LKTFRRILQKLGEENFFLFVPFLKTKDASAQSASEKYRQMLIQIAAQLRKADAEFRNAATRLLELLSAQLGKPRLDTSFERRQLASRPGATRARVPNLSLGKTT
jgi:hypothetical protein